MINVQTRAPWSVILSSKGAINGEWQLFVIPTQVSSFHMFSLYFQSLLLTHAAFQMNEYQLWRAWAVKDVKSTREHDQLAENEVKTARKRSPITISSSFSLNPVTIYSRLLKRVCPNEVYITEGSNEVVVVRSGDNLIL